MSENRDMAYSEWKLGISQNSDLMEDVDGFSLKIGFNAGYEAKQKKLQEFAIWLTGCGYDFTQHQYFLDNRHLLTGNSEQG